MKKGKLRNLTATDGSSAAVGARELGELRTRWNEYRTIVNPENGTLDPVAALQSTGAVLEAVHGVIATSGGSRP